MAKRMKQLCVGVSGVTVVALCTAATWWVTSPRVSPEDAQRGWPDKWIGVAIQSGGEWKMDFAWADALYAGSLRWPWHVKVSFESPDSAKMVVGAVPKGCLLSNVKGRWVFVPKKRESRPSQSPQATYQSIL
jgi:hypothetical protein